SDSRCSRKLAGAGSWLPPSSAGTASDTCSITAGRDANEAPARSPSRRARTQHPSHRRETSSVSRSPGGGAGMMGRSHAASGAVVGLALAPALGLDTTETIPFAVAVAGYAIFPDLDCGGATASKLLGPLTSALSWLVCRLSAMVYRATRTDTGSTSAGTHRHLTHTIAFAVGMGLLAWCSAPASPWVVAAR